MVSDLPEVKRIADEIDARAASLADNWRELPELFLGRACPVHWFRKYYWDALHQSTTEERSTTT